MKHSCILFTQEGENGKPVHRSSFIVHRYLRMKKLVVVFLASASALLFSCESAVNEENNLSEPIKIVLTETELHMSQEGNAFAANLFATVKEHGKEQENMLISPLSLNMALAMVWNGAGGETKQSIQKAMGMGNYPPSEVNGYFKKLREALLKTDPMVKLAIANSIWSRKGFPVKPDFYNINREWYNAEVRELDFSAANAPDIINQWCSDNTNGLIDKMIDEIPNDLMMYLINALYFKGEWANGHGFVAEKTANELFYKEDGSPIEVKMMQQNSELGYFSDELLSATALPYGNKAFSMVFILPNQGVSFDAVLNQLKQVDYWNKCMYPSGNYDVNLYIPSFKFEYETSLNETLRQLGMEIAFSSLADFSGISDVALAISTVKQKAVIEVNEEGSEAAAVTVVEMVYTTIQTEPQPITFKANRPFLFAIKENSTGTVLFMGKIGNPE
jgi:serpin B